MNMREGLERINLAWWGFCGLIGALFAVGILASGGSASDASLGAAGAFASLCMYLLVRWIIRGFFPAGAT